MKAKKKSGVNGSTRLSSVTTLVTGWTLDFMFISLCRHFKEGNLDKFNETLSAFEGISQSPSVKGEHVTKVIIAAFLARIMHGKELDTQFDDEAKVTPLMSAAKVWSDLKATVMDKSLFRTINDLLLVQSVAACLEKRTKSSASSALKWFDNNLECPKTVMVQLREIVKTNETHHPVLKSYSYSRLLMTVESFLDAYLERNPSDYLLKMATEMVQSSEDMDCSGDSGPQDSCLSEPVSKSAKNKDKKRKSAVRSKKKLLSTKIDEFWQPDTCKKPFVSLRRISMNEISQLISKKTINATNTSKCLIEKRKMPQKWTAKLDKYLMDGVKRHGQGKWSRILLAYDFEGRTGVMLKDRWRVLVRSNKVD